MLQQAKKPAKSPFGRIFAVVVVATAAYAAFSSGLVDRALEFLPTKGDHGAAERAANMLRDAPECATYRRDILKYKGRPSTDATRGEITRLVEQGIAAGCKKSDLS